MGCVFSRPDYEIEDHRLRVVRKIAEGGFSEVFLVEDVDSGEKFAMKNMNVDEDDVAAILREAEVHRRHVHENIVRLECHGRPDTAHYVLVFPFFNKGSLAQLLEQKKSSREHITQANLLRMGNGICRGIAVLHADHVAHRDLKPANVMLTPDFTPVLTDFGSSVTMPKEIRNAAQSQAEIDSAAEQCSMPYRAPELFSCELGTTITLAIDIWSLGCVLYAMEYWESPFDAVHAAGNSVALAAQSPHRLPFPSLAPYDSQLNELIRDLLKVDPTERLPIEGVIERLGMITE